MQFELDPEDVTTGQEETGSSPLEEESASS